MMSKFREIIEIEQPLQTKVEIPIEGSQIKDTLRIGNVVIWPLQTKCRHRTRNLLHLLFSFHKKAKLSIATYHIPSPHVIFIIRGDCS